MISQTTILAAFAYICTNLKQDGKWPFIEISKIFDCMSIESLHIFMVFISFAGLIVSAAGFLGVYAAQRAQLRLWYSWSNCYVPGTKTNLYKAANAVNLPSLLAGGLVDEERKSEKLFLRLFVPIEPMSGLDASYSTVHKISRTFAFFVPLLACLFWTVVILSIIYVGRISCP